LTGEQGRAGHDGGEEEATAVRGGRREGERVETTVPRCETTVQEPAETGTRQRERERQVMADKSVPSAVYGEGPADNSDAVAAHFATAAASGADPTADMRDGDDDSGSVAPDVPDPSVKVQFAGRSPATMAGRGSGTP
jgi:hypothetical protein